MELVPYLKAGYPVLYLLSSEESRIEMQILEASQECKRKLLIWSHTEGIISPDDKIPTENIEDPIDALEYILKKGEKSTIFVFRDLPLFFKGPPRIVRLIRDIARDFKQSKKTLIITSPIREIPSSIERDITVIDFDLPGREEMEKCWNLLYTGATKKAIGEIPADDIDRIIQSAMGLTTVEAENAFAKAIVEWNADNKNKDSSDDSDNTSIASYVMNEKAAAVKKSGILEYYPSVETAKDIGGLENLKEWLTFRAGAFSKKARAFGLPMPRGILLAGLPGCGKSLSAKAASNILGVPLIRFDVGRVFGGLVGESEENMRRVIQTAEAVGNCVLWIDEMEKAFAGMMNGGSGDSGTSQRVFGNFITWMQEKTVPCFIVATVNRIAGLPPELLRKGRFDEIFFVGLPSNKEREMILKIHISKYGRDPKNFNLKKSVEESEGFSGAELEESVKSGLYTAFFHDRELETKDLTAAIVGTNPLSNSRKEELQEMSNWAKDNAVSASVMSDGGVISGRELDL